eukprot:scaffold1513_cov141-Cylindrotheca_fusiformis.AAC.4
MISKRVHSLLTSKSYLSSTRLTLFRRPANARTCQCCGSNCRRSFSSKENSALAFQSLLKERRTGTVLKHSSSLESRQEEQQEIAQALERAVACAQMAPNHRLTEAFSFRQIMHSSQSANAISEIVYQVVANARSIPVAKQKREKWSEATAFLVSLVHDNQKSQLDANPDDEYVPLPYSPPETERQLEDYAAASAAIQNVMLSLHAEGIGTKWSTSPVIHTPAFRKLVQADPTDRVAGFIMVGGVDSTSFGSERERHITNARRRRRRSLVGDFLIELP